MPYAQKRILDVNYEKFIIGSDTGKSVGSHGRKSLGVPGRKKKPAK